MKHEKEDFGTNACGNDGNGNSFNWLWFKGKY